MPGLNRQSVAHNHPQRRVLQLLAQRAKHLFPRVRAVVVRQLLERVGLRRVEESPKLVLGDTVLSIRDVGLLQHAILVLSDQVIRNVLLKVDLGLSFTCHTVLATFPTVPTIP